MTARKRLILDLLWMCALAGALAAGFRLWFGLGATTALSDAFPWGLWKILNMVAGVALSTGGFTLGFLVYALGKKRYAPLLKSAILIAFLGYGSSCLALLFDIGLPQRFWHPIVFWNETSFLFEVFWCVLLYFTVTAIEVMPIFLERLGIRRPLPFLHRIAFVVVTIGVSLSCLHHSSLGSLFLVTPLRLYSLWYSPILPLVFILSAMGAGLMVVVLARLFSLWVFEPEALEDSAGTEIQRLTGLARIAAWILGLYLLLKLSDLAVRGQFSILLEANLESGLFLLETLLLAVLPILLVAVPRTRYSHAGLAAASFSTVMGLVLNRLDVGIFGYFRDAHAVYFPSSIEWALSIGVIAAALLVFLFCVEHLSVFDHAVGAERAGATPTGDRFVGTLRIPSIVLRHGLYRVTLFSVFWVPLVWMLLYPPFATHHTTLVQPSLGLDAKRSLLWIDGNRSGLGVAFPHAEHQKRLGGDGSCVNCHHISLPHDHSTPCSRCHRNMVRESRLFNHSEHIRLVAAEKKLSGLHAGNYSCGFCHPSGLAKQASTVKPCLECHREDMSAQKLQQTGLQQPCGFAEAMHDTCLKCHRTHTEKPELSRCSHCHRELGPKPDDTHPQLFHSISLASSGASELQGAEKGLEPIRTRTK